MLEHHIEHYKDTFLACPEGYESNVSRALSFYIPSPNQTTILAKWVCQLDDRHVAGFSEYQGPTDSPHITELYLWAAYDMENPLEPLPGWFQASLMDTSAQYHTFKEKVTHLDDWSAFAKIHCHQAICDELGEVQHQLDILDAHSHNLVEKQQLCKFRLEGGKISARVKHFEHLAPHAPQIVKC
jgi:hypothetical protein